MGKIEKKYKVVASFAYRGEDGKNKKSVIISPGEDVPALDPNERERLIRQSKIALLSENGEVIPFQTPEDLQENQIENLLTKSPTFINSFLVSRQSSRFPLSKETLSKMYTIAEQKHLPKAIIEKIEQLLQA